MSLQDFISTLDPKTAKRIKTAQETEAVRHPLASKGLTLRLGGGIGAGRVTTLYGNTSSGKSLLMMQSIGRWQKMGLICAYADAEGTYDKAFAARLGVNNEELILIQKKSFGALTDEVVPLLEKGLDILVIDSVSDLLPEVFVDSKTGEMNEFGSMKQVGAHAKSSTIMLNALHYANQKTAIVIISQTTTEIGQTYTKQIPHGGKKLLFGSSQIIKLHSSPNEKDQIKGKIYAGDKLIEQPIGRSVLATIEKNKLGAPGGQAEYDMYYAGDSIGIDDLSETVKLAVTYGVIDKSGSWYYHGGKQWQGESSTIEALREDDQIRDLVEKELKMVMTGEV